MGKPDIENYTIAIAGKGHVTSSKINNMPWILINKNSEDEKAYKIAGSLFGNGFQCLV